MNLFSSKKNKFQIKTANISVFKQISHLLRKRIYEKYLSIKKKLTAFYLFLKQGRKEFRE